MNLVKPSSFPIERNEKLNPKVANEVCFSHWRRDEFSGIQRILAEKLHQISDREKKFYTEGSISTFILV